jgi:hypothetical protein
VGGGLTRGAGTDSWRMPFSRTSRSPGASARLLPSLARRPPTPGTGATHPSVSPDAPEESDEEEEEQEDADVGEARSTSTAPPPSEREQWQVAQLHCPRRKRKSSEAGWQHILWEHSGRGGGDGGFAYADVDVGAGPAGDAFPCAEEGEWAWTWGRS